MIVFQGKGRKGSQHLLIEMLKLLEITTIVHDLSEIVLVSLKSELIDLILLGPVKSVF